MSQSALVPRKKQNEHSVCRAEHANQDTKKKRKMNLEVKEIKQFILSEEKSGI